MVFDSIKWFPNTNILKTRVVFQTLKLPSAQSERILVWFILGKLGFLIFLALNVEFHNGLTEQSQGYDVCGRLVKECLVVCIQVLLVEIQKVQNHEQE